MSSDLTFNAHIDSIYSIALRVIGLTKRKADVGLDAIAKELGLEPITTRCLYNDVSFIYKLISGQLICPEFLQKINFRVLAFNSRYNPPFWVLQHSSNLIANNPKYRLLNHCNDIPNFDFCFDSLAKLKDIVMNSS
ncbi:Uncharacterized protein FWK35_00032895 [Aphis craccivora]|uniref:Uncharacterized protein n=1 Tax=Aphis craccivora TaxID=307492 RepID=A0A6G0ZNB5_APHCR|nr:Uncharacterized protein FWK35_00032895 [Aphis craccivora]